MVKRLALLTLIVLVLGVVTVDAAEPWLPPFEFDSALEGDVIIEWVDVKRGWTRDNTWGDFVFFDLARSSDERLDYYIQMKTASGRTLGSYLGEFKQGEKKQKIKFNIIPGTVLLKFNKDD